MANAGLLTQVTGATEWHINADEADAFDYNLEFFRDPALFSGDAFRASDHDPVIVGLDLGGTLTITGNLTEFSATTSSPSIAQLLTVSGSNLPGDLTVTAPEGFELSLDGETFSSVLILTATNGTVEPTTLFIRLGAGEVGSTSGAIVLSSGASAETSDFQAFGSVSEPMIVPEPAALPLLFALGAILYAYRSRRR